LAGRAAALLVVNAREAHNLIDLGSDTYFDPEARLNSPTRSSPRTGCGHAGPRGAAWAQYRVGHALCDRPTAMIAEREGRNFLVAAMAVVLLSHGPGRAAAKTKADDRLASVQVTGEDEDEHMTISACDPESAGSEFESLTAYNKERAPIRWSSSAAFLAAVEFRRLGPRLG